MDALNPHPLVLALLVVATAVVAVPVASSTPHESTDVPMNYTVTLSDHRPGAPNVTVTEYAALRGPQRAPTLEFWDWYVNVEPAGLENDCETEDARAAGVDRDNDDPGAKTDDTFVGKYSQQVNATNSEAQRIDSYDFYEPNSFAGENISLGADDQIVVQLAACYQNPKRPGWYRLWTYVNGTEDGRTYENGGKFNETNAYSHWWYVCDCDSYDAAVNELGAPPSYEYDGSHEVDRERGTIPRGGMGPWDLSDPRKPAVEDTPTPEPTPTMTETARPATPTPTPTATETPFARVGPVTVDEPDPNDSPFPDVPGIVADLLGDVLDAVV